MSRKATFRLFFLAVFLQAGAYGLTFMLPRLFAGFNANEKAVGGMLVVAAVSTLISVYFSGHLSDRFGRVFTLGAACFAISLGLASYGLAQSVGALTVLAGVALGAGWGLTYALAPVVMTGLVQAGDRVRYFAVLSVMVMAGFGLSPVMASLMEKAGLGVKDAFFVVAFLCALAGGVFFMLIRAVRTHSFTVAETGHGRKSGASRRCSSPSSSLSFGTVVRIMRSPARLPVIMGILGASVFAGMNNFQTVFADERNLNYAAYFLVYTVTVVVFRLMLARFKGGANPYGTIAALQSLMAASPVLFLFIGESAALYLAVAFLFGIGYGVSYPVLVAMAANDADADLLAQTLQLFALSYFIGIFGFPLVAGWMIVATGSGALLVLVAALAAIEATLALVRAAGHARRSRT